MNKVSPAPRRLPYFFALLLAVLSIVSLLLVFENWSLLTPLFGDGPVGDVVPVSFTNREYLLALGATLAVFLSFRFVVKRHFKATENWPFLILFSVLFIGSVLAVVFGEGIRGETGELIYKATELPDVLRWCSLAFVSYFGLYSIVAYVPKIARGTQTFKIVVYVVMGIALAAVIYSLATETELYVEWFKMVTEGGEMVDYPKSWMDNRNVFGILVFMVMPCEMYLQVKRPSWHRWIVMLLVALFELILMSKATLLCVVTFLPIVFVWSVVRGFKKHPIQRLALLFSGLLIVAIIAISPFLSEFGILTEYSNYARKFFEELPTLLQNSTASRDFINEKILRYMNDNPLSLVFGFGLGNARPSINAIMNGDPNVWTPLDNTWVYALVNGGIIAWVAQIVMWIGVFAIIVKGFYRRSSYAMPIFATYLAFLFRSFGESATFNVPNVYGFLLLLLIPLPLMAEEYRAKKPELMQMDATAHVDSLQFVGKPFGKSAFDKYFIVTSLPFAVLLVLLPWMSLFTDFSFPWLDNYFIASLAVTAFGFPFVLASCHNAFIKKKGALGAFLILFALAELISPLAVFFLEPMYALIISGGVLLLAAFVALLGKSAPSFSSIVRVILIYSWPLVAGTVVSFLYMWYLPVMAFGAVLMIAVPVSLWVFVNTLVLKRHPFAHAIWATERRWYYLEFRSMTRDRRKYETKVR